MSKHMATNLVEDEEKKQSEEAVKKTIETNAAVELSPKETEAQRKFFSLATFEELLKATGKTAKEILKNPRRKKLLDEQINMGEMALLTVAELIPGIEITNDVTKVLAIGQEVVNKGKKKGLFAKLYSHVPPGLNAVFEGIDILSPLPLSEIWQMTGDRFNIWKYQFLLTKDAAVATWKNFAPVFRPNPQVAQAAAQFR